jgi:hypothetical protein
MTENPQILFNKTLEQLRQLGAWGGRTYGRNQRARKALAAPRPQAVRPCLAPRETVAQAIRSLDAKFPWLSGVEKSLSQNQKGSH